MKKTVISFLMAGLLLIGMPALAQEGDLPDPEWQAVVTEQGGTRWDLDTATIMKRGEGRVAGFRKTQPDGSYGLTLGLFTKDRRMAPIMKLSVTKDHEIKERWRAEKEEWVTIEPGSVLEKIYDAVWKAPVSETLSKDSDHA